MVVEVGDVAVAVAVVVFAVVVVFVGIVIASMTSTVVGAASVGTALRFAWLLVVAVGLPTLEMLGASADFWPSGPVGEILTRLLASLKVVHC